MKESTWKTIAIVCLVILVLENGFLFLGYKQMAKEEEQLKICYYDICEEYPEAEVTSGVCHCYDYDVMGDYVWAKSEILD